MNCARETWPIVRPWLVFLVIALATSTLADVALAQRDLPPEKGGMTYELGMPPVYKGRSGFELGWYRPGSSSDLSGFYNLGVSKDLGSPVVGIAALRLEGYIGITSQELDGGGRALFEVPSFRFGLGADYSAADEVVDVLFALDLPVHRGGLFGRGTTLAVRWLPSRDLTFSVGVNVPLWGRNIGATRPKQDHVRLEKRRPERLELDLAESALAQVLGELRQRALGVFPGSVLG